MLSIFYTRKEIATRISILYTGNILATAFAGLIAIGIFKLDEVAGLSGWQWLAVALHHPRCCNLRRRFGRSICASR